MLLISKVYPFGSAGITSKPPGQGELAPARLLLERALAIHEKVLGPDHSNTATSLNNLARLLQDQGELAAARTLYEHALAIKKKVLGADHPRTAQTSP
jgi:hypothetical protein